MKRLAAIFLCTALALTGCKGIKGESGSAENGLNRPFSADAEIMLDEMKATGKLTRFGAGDWAIEFDSPNTLSGVKLEFSGGSSNASYKGLDFSVPQSALPVRSVMDNLIEVTDELARNEELSGESENGELKIGGRIESGDYTFIADRSGNIRRFEMPNMKLIMNFGNVTNISGNSVETATETETAVTTGISTETTT